MFTLKITIKKKILLKRNIAFNWIQVFIHLKRF